MVRIADIRRGCVSLARRIRRRARWTAAGLTAAAVVWSGVAQAETLHSKSRTFRIPFQFDAQELDQLGAKEVRLYVSQDAGTTWELARSVTPEQAKFTYQADEDREYWFSVKSIVVGGHEYPAGPHQPGLKVLVDTEQPQLTLRLREESPGSLSLEWTADDPQLISESLRLEATDPNGANWRPIAVENRPQGAASWRIAKPGTVSVRGSVRDRAGNVRTVTAQIESTPLPQEHLQGEPVIANAALSHSGTVVVDGAAPSMLIRPAAGTETQTANSRTLPTGGTRTVDLATLAGTAQNDQVRPLFDDEPRTPAPRPIPLATPSPLAPATSGAESPFSSASAPQSALTVVTAQTRDSEPTRRRVLVNTRAIRVAYEIEGVGPSGVGTVQVYITEDGGRSWFHYGADADRQSPAQIVVPGDGDYGFAVRVANGLGLISPPPQPGDPADVNVTVDQVNPVVRLLPLKQGRGLNQNQVLIEWTAQDRQLAELPVSLYYAAQPTGPWLPIVEWHSNSGRYELTLPGNVNQRLYVRIDVRDAAGNVTRLDGETPLIIDKAQPKARITEVESLRTGP